MTTKLPSFYYVREKMERLKISQQRLAKAAGVPQSSLSNMLRGKNVTILTVQKITDCLKEMNASPE